MKIKICLSGKKNFIKFTQNNQKGNFVKIVKKKLQGDKFIKLKIDYILCKFCGHFNGIYQDTKYLSKKFYQDSEAKKYSKIYLEKEKKITIKELKIFIYLRLNFCFKIFKNLKIKKNDILNKFNFIDIGCGSGYFLSSLRKLKIKNTKGYDPSKQMVNYGNFVNKFNYLNFLNHEKTIDIIKNIDEKKKTCISMIGSMEHIYNQNDILREIKKKKI